MKRGATIANLLLLARTVLVVVTGTGTPKESNWGLQLLSAGVARDFRPDLFYRMCEPLGLPWGEVWITLSEMGDYDGIPIDEFR